MIDDEFCNYFMTLRWKLTCYIFRIHFIVLIIHQICLNNVTINAAAIYNSNPIIKLGFKEIHISQSIIKTYTISDLHADSIKNTQWVQNNCYRKPEDISITTTSNNNDIFTILLLPGDICTEIDRLENIFQWLTSQYNMICFVPGNHELWRRGTSTSTSASTPDSRTNTTNRMAENSIHKFTDILSTARKYNIYIEPVRITSIPTNHSICIIPLYSWYHANFDTEPSITNHQYLLAQTVIPFQKMWSDFSMCSWPVDMIESEEFTSLITNNTILAEYFADINEQFLPLSTSTSALPFSLPLNQVMVNESEEMMNTKNRHQFSHNYDDMITDTMPNHNITTITITTNTITTTPTNNTPPITAATLNNTNNSTVYDSTTPTTTTPATTTAITDTSSRINIHNTDTIISFSHFVPRRELCPEKRFLVEPGLTRVMGSKFLEAQIRRLKPHIHIFGHTHIPIDLEIEGIRYLQWPLGTSRESKRQCVLMHQHGPLLISDTSVQPIGILPQLISLSVSWTKYYTHNKRNASIVDIIAPWTQKRIDHFSGLITSVLKSRERDINNQS